MYIGIDIGGTNTRIIPSMSYEEIKEKGTIIFKTPIDFSDGIDQIFNFIDSLNFEIKAIGITMAGRISEDGKEFIKSNNLSNWTNKGIVEKIKNKYNCSVYLENDAVSQGLAEYYYGKHNTNNFLYLVWGTGIGGTMVASNQKQVISQKFGRESLQEAEERIGGNILDKRYGKNITEITDQEWKMIILEFKDLIISLSNQFKISKVVIAGGIVDKKKEIVENILCNDNISISILGKYNGVYGGIALIKYNN